MTESGIWMLEMVCPWVNAVADISLTPAGTHTSVSFPEYSIRTPLRILNFLSLSVA
jgi:hypothetical protein